MNVLFLQNYILNMVELQYFHEKQSEIANETARQNLRMFQRLPDKFA